MLDVGLHMVPDSGGMLSPRALKEVVHDAALPSFSLLRQHAERPTPRYVNSEGARPYFILSHCVHQLRRA